MIVASTTNYFRKLHQRIAGRNITTKLCGNSGRTFFWWKLRYSLVAVFFFQVAVFLVEVAVFFFRSCGIPSRGCGIPGRSCGIPGRGCGLLLRKAALRWIREPEVPKGWMEIFHYQLKKLDGKSYYQLLASQMEKFHDQVPELRREQPDSYSN